MVARVYRSLPPEEQKKAAIFGQNYGQAGAIDHFGPALGLPKAISGHLSYFLWGPRGYTGDVMIVMDDHRASASWSSSERRIRRARRAPLLDALRALRRLGLPRRPRQPLAAVWPELKKYD